MIIPLLAFFVTWATGYLSIAYGLGGQIFLGGKRPFQHIVQRAQFCGKHGFDSVLIDDQLLYGTESVAAPGPFTTLATIAAGTRKIKVGIAVTDL